MDVTGSDDYTETLERLSIGTEAQVCNDLALRGARLAEELAAFPGTHVRGDEALQRFDDGLDHLLAPTVALIGLGSSVSVRALCVAVDTLAASSAGATRGHTAVASAVLARAVLVSTASALSWRRPEVIVALGGVARAEGRGAPVSVVKDTALRHLEVFERGADNAYRAHVEWFARRPWRGAIGPLATDDQILLAFAEADVLMGMLAAGASRDRPLYAAGLTTPGRRVEDRLLARAADPRQRSALCSLFGVPDSQLDQRLADSYAALTAGDSLTSFRTTLFPA